MSFKDKVALVTGGASGIGRELCRQLAAKGARVAVCDINLEGASRVAEELPAARAVELNVTDLDHTRAVVEETVEQEGRLDLMFNNAGVAVVGELEDIEVSDWSRILDVNVRGVVNGVAAGYPRMVQQGSGHIVNIASVAGLIPVPGMAHYAASKHAVVGLSLSVRHEGALKGVRVSVVCPQIIDTAMTDTIPMVNMDREEAKKQYTPIPVDKCVRTILRGVARNRAIILVGGQARFFSWLYRHIPWMAHRLAAGMARKNARLKRAAASSG